MLSSKNSKGKIQAVKLDFVVGLFFGGFGR